MARLIVLALVSGAVLLLLDRLLLRMEEWGWINYRRNGLSRGAAMYHTLQLTAVFQPEMQHVIETKYEVREEADESGDPPAREDSPGD